MGNIKKSNKRSRTKYPALDPSVNLLSRQELINDYDYLHKLSEKDLTWLNKFTEEYVNASFSKDNKKNLHKTKTLKKDCYNKNNSRNRCIFSKEKASSILNYLEDMGSKKQNLTEPTVSKNIIITKK